MARMGGSSTDCEYCVEFASGVRRIELDTHLGTRSRLHSSGSCTVFPTVSPMAPGHVLVAPSTHRRSIASCTEDEQRDVARLSSILASALETATDEICVFEHGLGSHDAVGCGVAHAHKHIVPLPPEVIDGVAADLRRRFTATASGEADSLLAGAPDGAEYILFGRADQAILCEAPAAPSQLVRQLICGRLGTNWDWRDFTAWASFDLTLDRIQDLPGLGAVTSGMAT